MSRRVVVTGMGVITPIGLNVEEFFKSIKEGKHGFGPITRFDSTDYKCHVAAEVKEFDPKEYMDALQVEPSEFELINYPERGTCLYRCGNERYLLQVIAPEYKAAMFGKAGGR